MTPAINLATIPWIPQDIAATLAGKVLSFPVPERLRARFNRPPRVSLLKWAETYRDLGKGKGIWSRRKTPHAVGIMAALDHPMVEMVVECKGPQTGGTEVLLNFIGSCIHQNPENMMIITSDDDNARNLSNDRIQPMINGSASLSAHLGRDDADVSGKRIALDNMTIFMASANSASQMASRACKYVLFDETDKYPPTANKAEADPISLGIARTTTFENSGRKMFLNSTPTSESGNIWQYLQSCQLVFHYWAKCPHCGKRQPMLFKHIVWDGGREAEPNEIEAKRLARYACQGCGVLWDDEDRNQAVRKGRWRADSGGQDRFAEMDRTADKAGRKGIYLEQALRTNHIRRVGFHVPAWISPFSSMSQTVGAFLRAPHKEAGWRDFANRFEGLPWINIAGTRKESAILDLRTDLDDNIVPAWADALILGADTQDDGFWYELRAFERGPYLRSHGVARGFVDTFEALTDIILAAYPTEDGRTATVGAGFIDAMGHRTLEVYQWCGLHPHIWAVKGMQKADTPLPDHKKIERFKNRVLPGSATLQPMDVNVFKTFLSGKLQHNPDAPGAFTFSNGMTPQHARQYLAEEIDPKTNYWTCAHGKANHLWDCSVYALACARKHRLHLSLPSRPAKAPTPKKQKHVRPDRW